jgi:hypothetical protein
MERTNFFYLLSALLFLMLAIPLAHDIGVLSVPVVRAIVFSVLLLVGVWSLKGSHQYFFIGMAFVVVGIVLNILAINLEPMAFGLGSMLCMIGFLIVAIAFTLKQVVFGTEMPWTRIRQ